MKRINLIVCCLVFVYGCTSEESAIPNANTAVKVENPAITELDKLEEVGFMAQPPTFFQEMEGSRMMRTMHEITLKRMNDDKKIPE